MFQGWYLGVLGLGSIDGLVCVRFHVQRVVGMVKRIVMVIL